MNPILYPSTETAFISNGLGVLSGAVSCIVTEELNGGYELSMQYPITGIHYDLIQLRSILYCKPTPTAGAQPFRVYRITKPLRGIVTVYAAHLSYDLSGVPLQPYTAGSVQAALKGIESSAAITHPFVTWSDMTNAGEMAVSVPTSARAVLGGSGGILETYGGELEYDHYAVRLWNARGTDRGTSIRYGKNLTSLEQDENCANVYTGIYPYYVPSGGAIVHLPEKVVNAPGTYNFAHILPVDMSGDFEDIPTQAQLREAAERYISEHQIGVPAVSLQVSFAQLEQTEEYKHLALLERVELGDTVSVAFPALGVSAKARCVKTVFNVLLGRFDSVELGDTRTTIATIIASQQAAINAVATQPVSTAVQAAIAAATQLITGNKGGHVILHSSTGAKEPDEILIMDTPDIDTAVNVWRWNKSGLGYSSTGYNGPYGTAITQDGSIVATYITSGEMDAARMTTGLLTSQDGRVQFDLSAGTLYIVDENQNIKLGFDVSGNLTMSGTVYASAGSFAGDIYASGGQIGGFTLSDGSLVAGNGESYIALNNPNSIASRLSLGYGYVEYNAIPILDVGAAIHVSPNLSTTGNLGAGDSLYVENRIYMYNPPSASSSANVRLVNQGDYYSFGIIDSSRRYKKDIHDIREFDSVSERIDRVSAVTYSPRSGLEKGRYYYGFVAEDMEKEFPWLVEYSTDKNGVIQAQSVFYDRTPTILWADAQETHERLRIIEAKLAELEEK